MRLLFDRPLKVKIEQNKKYLLTLLAMLLLLVLFRSFAKRIFFIILFVILNSAIAFLKRFTEIPIEFEAKTIGIVLIARSYGLGYGISFILIASLLQVFLRQRFNLQMIMEVFTDIMLAYVSIILPISNIVIIGVIVSILNFILIFIFLNFVFSAPPSVTIIACVSNLIFNLFIFQTLGESIILLMNI